MQLRDNISKTLSVALAEAYADVFSSSLGPPAKFAIPQRVQLGHILGAPLRTLILEYPYFSDPFWCCFRAALGLFKPRVGGVTAQTFYPPLPQAWLKLIQRSGGDHKL